MARTLRVVGEVADSVVARADPAAGLDTLEDVLRFGFAQQPAWELAFVTVQDELTHDVVFAGPGPGFLVFDTT